MISMKYLHYFQILAQTEHYGNAAELLGIAQPSLSYAIESMEKELGFALFEKNGRNVQLTRAGSEYRRYVDQALSVLEAGQAASRQMETHSLRIGYVSSVRKEIFAALARFRERYPQQELYLLAYEGLTHQLLGQLRQGKLDLILGSSPGEDEHFISFPWLTQKLVVVSSQPLPQDGIPLEEASKLPLVVHSLDSGMGVLVGTLFSRNGLKLDRRAEAAEDLGVLSLVKLSLGSAIMTDSEEVRSSGLFVVPLLHQESLRTVYLTRLRGHSLSDPVLKFQKLLLEK